MRGKRHYLHHYEKGKTACGLDSKEVWTTFWREMINCKRCRRTKYFWNNYR